MKTQTFFLTAALCGTTTLAINSNNTLVNNGVFFTTNKTANKKFVVSNTRKKEELEELSLNSVSTGGINIYCSNGDFKMKVIQIDSIDYDGRKLAFKNHFYLPYYVSDGYYYADCLPLELFCSGSDLHSLVEEIKENIYVSWKLYVDCDETELSEDAKMLRQELMNKLYLV